MKKRMWLWCLIAAFGLSFSVACSDDDEKEDVTPTPTQPVPPTQGDQQTPEDPAPSQSVIVVDTMDVTANIEEVPYTGGTITFTTTTNQDYTVASTADWITIDSDGRALTATYTVTATVAANEGEAREGKITVTFADEAATVKEVVVKQAAYVAPEQTPQTPVVPEPGTGIVADLTIDFEYEAGAASAKIDGAEITAAAKEALGLEDLSTATIMGFLADGTMAELQTTVAVEGGYACDGWMTVDGTMTSWGTEHAICIKPWNTPESMDLFLANTEVGTTAVGYFAYVSGDNDYVVKVNVTVIEAPEVPEVPGIEIEADYVLEVEVAQDNGYGATYIALDGTEFGYWGAYSDPEKYVTTIKDVSVDITPEIEAALGIEADGLEDAINGGSVYVGAYGLDENGEVYFRDCYEEKGSNFFYWFSEAGYAQGWGDGAFFCIDNIGFHSDAIQLYGTTCMFPNSAQIGSTYSGYVVFKTDDAEYVVEVKGTAVAAPEKVALPEMEVVKEYSFEFDAVYVPDQYSNDPSQFTLESQIVDIETLIGGEVNQILMSYLDENLEVAFQEWTETDGWFGADGATGWGNGSITFMKPNTDGTFSEIGTFYSLTGGEVAVCTYRYCNTTTLKAVDVTFTVTAKLQE